jgi:hypothetical protein
VPTRKEQLLELAALYDQLEKLTRDIAAAEEALRSGNDTGITTDVTRAQSKRRGLAIARGKADDREHSGGRAIAQAIAADPRWGSLTRYAKSRLRISQPALSRYLSGDLDVPPEVAAAVLADFGLDRDAWPKRRK